MSMSSPTSDKGGFEQTALTALRLGAVLFAVYLCFRILAPFISLILFGAILAVAINPLHRKLAAALGNRTGWSATLITLLGLTFLIAPVVVLTESLMTSSAGLAANIADGTAHVPPPPERIRDWPVVGDKLYSAWQLASNNLGAALERFSPQLHALGERLLAAAGGAGAAALQMFVSIIIAGVFLGTADKSLAVTRSVLNGLVGERGVLLLAESETTIQSVARGVVGVAIIEAILVAIGLMVADVPAAGLWTFLVLVLSIAQIPPLLVLLPLIAYVLSAKTAFGATVFIVCSFLAFAVDTFLKPVLLGRTANAPMLVILLGAIGGMLLWGIAGLFVGAVVLVLCWGALEFWIMDDNAPSAETEEVPAESTDQ